MIGILGGSGFYKFLNGKEVLIKTPYGFPSDKVLLSEYRGRKIAFLPRHGKNHQFPPHKIPYRANFWAFKKLGVERVLSSCAVGSLQPGIKPGDFVIPNQLIDRTKNREDTFFNGPKAIHISLADPYCPELRESAIKACQNNNLRVHKKGTIVVIQGPRFSTRAESNWFSEMNWDIINMTQYPEVSLAREMEMCYVSIALVTDYDAGLKGNKKIKPVTSKEIVEIFKHNLNKLKNVILDTIQEIPENASCQCQNALKNAEL